MKTQRFFLTVLASGVISFASATEKPQVQVQSVGSDQVMVYIAPVQASEVEIDLSDKNGQNYYYHNTGKPVSGYRKIFDFNQVENGEYVLRLKVNDQVSERELTIGGEEIRVGKEEEVAAPYFYFDGEKLVLTHLNFEEESYTLKISDNERLLYETRLAGKSPLFAGFDLSQLDQGQFDIQLNSDKQEFYHRIKK